MRFNTGVRFVDRGFSPQMRDPVVSGLEVPQANQILRVRELVRLLAANDMERLAAVFADPRDRAFYFTAARILGLVEGRELLTSAGMKLAAAEGELIYRGLAAGFETSIVGKAWLEWAGVRDVRSLEPNQAKAFLDDRGTSLKRSTRNRRASTLRAWIRDLRRGLPALPGGVGTGETRAQEQLTLPGLLHSDPAAHPDPPVEIKWPQPARFPHNEGSARVAHLVREDLVKSRAALIVSGYAALGTLVEFLESREIGDGHIRILLGNEPFPLVSARPETSARNSATTGCGGGCPYSSPARSFMLGSS